jgi:hypothetical protein
LRLSSPPTSLPHPRGPFDRMPLNPLPSLFTRPPTLLNCVESFYHRSRPLLVALLLCLFIIGYPAFEQFPHLSLSDARPPARTPSSPPPIRERLPQARLFPHPFRVFPRFTLQQPRLRDDWHSALPTRRLHPTTNQGTPVPWSLLYPFATLSQGRIPYHCLSFDRFLRRIT